MELGIFREVLRGWVVKANFGTMTKPLHPGMAAERGVLAARLAARGFTANSEAVDGNQGYAQAAGGGVLDADMLTRWEGRWATPRTLFKMHAACHLTHAGIEATTSILDDGVDPVEIEAITLTVNPSILDVCGIAEPTTGLEAKFSLTGTQALVVNGADTSAVETFEDDPINDPAVRTMLRRVTVETDASMATMATRSVVHTRAGSHAAVRDVSEPAVDLGAQGEQLRRKFVALAQPVLGPDRTQALLGLLDRLPDVDDVAEVCRAAVPG